MRGDDRPVVKEHCKLVSILRFVVSSHVSDVQDGEPDVEMGNNCPPIDIPRHSLNDGEKKPSIGSDVSLL